MATILIADDALFFRKMLEDILSISGHTLIMAEDGEQASEIAQQQTEKLDLMVLDMVLPKKTGLEILMEAGELGFPILCVTGSDMVGEFEELQDLGATDFVQKSAPIEDIIYRINRLLFTQNKFSTRTNPRVIVRVQIQYRTPNAAYASNTFTISSEGLFIESPSPLPKGEMIQMVFYLPLANEKGKEIRCTGEVVWSYQSNQPAEVSGMGVVFKEISQFDSEWIQDFIQSYHSQPQ